MNDIVFERDIYKKFDYWYDNHRDSILYVQGARQVGKTFSILQYARKKFKNVAYIDLSDRVDFIELVNKLHYGSKDNIELLMQYISEINVTYTDDDDTVIILDEIQSSIDVYNKLRLLNRQTNCNWIVTGSYLGFIVNSNKFILSQSCDLWKVVMRPLSFSEFCRAIGKKYEYCDETLEAYNIYREIGGFPAVVKRYVTNKKVDFCYDVLAQLWNMFVDESKKYVVEMNNKDYLNACIELAINSVLNNKTGIDYDELPEDELTKLMTETLPSKMKIEQKYKVAIFNWLSSCGIINIMKIRDGFENLGGITKYVKIYFTDIGLIRHLFKGLYRKQDAIEGMISETFVLSELLGSYESPFMQQYEEFDKLYCYCDNKFEVEFAVLLTDADVSGTYAIEVKTSNGRTTSLNSITPVDGDEFDDNLLLNYKKLKYGIKFAMFKEQRSDSNKYNWPIFLAGKLDIKKIKSILDTKFDVDVHNRTISLIAEQNHFFTGNDKK